MFTVKRAWHAMKNQTHQTERNGRQLNVLTSNEWWGWLDTGLCYEFSPDFEAHFFYFQFLCRKYFGRFGSLACAHWLTSFRQHLAIGWYPQAQTVRPIKLSIEFIVFTVRFEGTTNKTKKTFILTHTIIIYYCYYHFALVSFVNILRYISSSLCVLSSEWIPHLHFGSITKSKRKLSEWVREEII